jgi:hypothetical protein
LQVRRRSYELFLTVVAVFHSAVFGVGRGVSGHPAARIIALIIWAALWGVVLALDPSFGQVGNWPVLLIALFVVPQLALGYFVGPWALVCVVPLAAIWAPLAQADSQANCVASGCETEGVGLFIFVAAVLALVWAVVIAAGYGLRVLRERLGAV